VKIDADATLAVDGGAPVRATFLPFHQPSIDADDERAVVDALRSGWITTGPKTKSFERALAAYTGAAHCVAVNSCTAALHLGLEAIGVGPGDEVITSPVTFASTANVIVHRGARPVFVDVEADTLNIDPAAIEAAITPRTKALIPVDFAGQPCDLDAIMATARRHGLTVIEDAAHAVGAKFNGTPIGSVADMTAFSFYATKNITSGEGGALTTDRAEWAERVQIMALHGISRDAWKRYGTSGYAHWDILAPWLQIQHVRSAGRARPVATRENRQPFRRAGWPSRRDWMRGCAIFPSSHFRWSAATVFTRTISIPSLCAWKR
jgi:dTDP-4-amino-4,6-dideoxygalactose transaminase